MHYRTVYTELWFLIAGTLTKYTTNSKNITEENESGYCFKIMKTILSFPFQYISLENFQVEFRDIFFIYYFVAIFFILDFFMY